MISDATSSWNKLKMLKDNKKTLVGCCNTSDQREMGVRNFAKSRRVFFLDAAEKLIHASVTSRLDYWNFLLSGCPSVPQSSAAHSELHSSSSD